MKYLIFFSCLAMPQSSVSVQLVLRQITQSQRSAVVKFRGKPVWPDYRSSQLAAAKFAKRILPLTENALREDGFTAPFSDSLYYVVSYEAEGYISGVLWCDTVHFYTWDEQSNYRPLRKKMAELDPGWQKIIKASTGNRDFLSALDLNPAHRNGAYTLFTKWYAADQPQKTHTFAFYYSPN